GRGRLEIFEREWHRAVAIARADEDLLAEFLAAGVLRRDDVPAGIDFDGEPVDLLEGRSIEPHFHVGEILAPRVLRADDDRRQAPLDLGSPARAVAANDAGADVARTDEELGARLHELAGGFQALGLFGGR